MILIKNAQVFAPKALGKKDVLLAYDKILEIADCIEPWRDDLTVIDAAGKMLVPGFIDQHVHIVGGGEVVEYADVFTIFENRMHPYTQGLFNSIPKLNEDVNRLVPIEGLMPDPTNLPTGCKFCTRCQHATDRCREEHPEMIDVGNGHLVRCFRAENTNAGGEQK